MLSQHILVLSKLGLVELTEGRMKVTHQGLLLMNMSRGSFCDGQRVKDWKVGKLKVREGSGPASCSADLFVRRFRLVPIRPGDFGMISGTPDAFPRVCNPNSHLRQTAGSCYKCVGRLCSGNSAVANSQVVAEPRSRRID